MNTFLKTSGIFIGVSFAVFAALLAILYITDAASQETLLDLLTKGALIAVVLFALSAVFSMTGNRSK